MIPTELPTSGDTIDRTPHVPALDGTHLNWLIDHYIQACRARLDRQATVDVYEDKLRWFTRWWEGEGPKCDWRLRQADLERFEKYLRAVVSPLTKRVLAYNTRHDVLRRLRKALRWAYENNHVKRDYSSWIPKADGGPPQRKAAGVAALRRLLDAAGDGANPPRDRAILAMLIGMGLRRAEIANLDVESMTFDEDGSGYADVTGKRTRAKPTGKRQAAFDSTTGECIAAHLAAAGYKDGPLFRNRFRQRIGAYGVYKIVKAAIRRAGLEGEIQACHDLRRAFATHHFRQRKDKALLQRQLGHVKYATTDTYTLLDINDIRREIVSPLSVPARRDVPPRTHRFVRLKIQGYSLAYTVMDKLQ